MSKQTNYLFVYFVIVAFLVFFLFTEFVYFMCSPPLCCTTKEGFDTTCVGPHVISLTDILLDNIDSVTKLQQINQLSFTQSESGNFKPILLATVKSPNSKLNDLDPDIKIEYLKQKIIMVYILNCENASYTPMSKIQDIKYLQSNNPEIQNALKTRKNPSQQILDIYIILQAQNNSYI